jgi:hypothetical protein
VQYKLSLSNILLKSHFFNQLRKRHGCTKLCKGSGVTPLIPKYENYPPCQTSTQTT